MKFHASPEHIAVLRNPTLLGAMKLWDFSRLGLPENDTVPLAGVHKARLQWSGASKRQIKESKKWLSDHGYSESFNND